MCDVVEDPFAFNEGDEVYKTGGDYLFAGIVVACFRKRNGAPRYVVENDAGILHIFNHTQLQHRKEVMDGD